MSSIYNPKLRVKFLRTDAINNTPIEPGNFIVNMDSGKVVVDILASNNTVRRVNLAGGIHYCGSVPTFEDLPAHPTNGDMYNVSSTDENWVWSDIENRWDNVSATLDLSDYYTKVEIDSTFVSESQIQSLIAQINDANPLN